MLALQKCPEAEILYCDTGSEHEDNPRFLHDCEKWFGKTITVLKNPLYADTWSVFEARQFLVSNHGAPCTAALKKQPARNYVTPGALEVFGYTVEEKERMARWAEENFDRNIWCPLIDCGMTKDECFDVVQNEGIQLPEMYLLGFRNNNCIACVKARDNINYWKRVRLHFPQQFQRMAALERKFGFALNRITRQKIRRRIFLDEIPPGAPTGVDESVTCGVLCGSETTTNP